MTGRRAAGSRLAHLIATSAGLGERLPAPGTLAGSLPAALLWWGVSLLVDSPVGRLWVGGLGVTIAVVAGVWAAGLEARRRNQEDPGPVVVDEVAGQWLTYLVAVPFVDATTPARIALTVAVGFVLFRLFDVVKPWPVNRLERLAGGVGIVADDLAAAVYAGALLVLALRGFG